MQVIRIEEKESGARLDAALASRMAGDVSRSRIKALIKEGNIWKSDQPAKDPAQKVRAGETYTIKMPQAQPWTLTPKVMELTILFEDEHLLVIDKPAGLTVHPAAGNYEDTLVHALLAHCGESLSGIGGVLRPGIVHRLDKDTSGAMVVAKHDNAHRALSAQLADRTLSRRYVALAWGVLSPSVGTINTLVGRSPANRKKMAVLAQGGKEAVTHYTTERMFYTQPTGRQPAKPLFSYIACKLHTGRTHQIRVHFAHKGHALIGDPLYGSKTVSRLSSFSEDAVPSAVRQALVSFPRQALHAAEIGFVHPVSRQPMQLTCNLPEDLRELIDISTHGLPAKNLAI